MEWDHGHRKSKWVPSMQGSCVPPWRWRFCYLKSCSSILTETSEGGLGAFGKQMRGSTKLGYKMDFDKQLNFNTNKLGDRWPSKYPNNTQGKTCGDLTWAVNSNWSKRMVVLNRSAIKPSLTSSLPECFLFHVTHRSITRKKQSTWDPLKHLIH